MKKYLYLLFVLPVLLSSCNEDSTTDTNTTTPDEEKPITEQLMALYDKMNEIESYGNKITYEQTQLDNYGAIEITASQRGVGVLYEDNFYHEDFTQKIDGNDQFNGVIEKGITTYQDTKALYKVVYYGKDSSDNKTSLYSYSDDLVLQFMEIDFKHHFINNFINYSYTLATNNSENKFMVESNILDLDFKNDGDINIKFNFKMYQKTDKAIELNSNDTVTIKDGHITKTISSYYISLMNNTNYSSVALNASYSYDESIKSYKGEKINPLDYYQE